MTAVGASTQVASCAAAQAPTLDALQRRVGELVERLRAGERGVLLAGTEGAFRAAWVLAEPGDVSALEQVTQGGERPPRPRNAPAPLAFLFPGQGAQRPGAAAWWIERPAFRASVEASAEVLGSRLPRPLLELLLAPDAELDATAVTQPLLVAFSLALVEQWKAWGVEPNWVAGHSLGEYTAAWAAGCCARHAVLELALERGRLMQGLPPGSMAVVFAAPVQVEALLADLGGAAWLAADNGANDAVIAGPPAAIERALELARLEGLEARTLAVSFAAHGPGVDPALPDLARAVARVDWTAPRCGWVSTRTAASQVAPPDVSHWRGQTREPVRFAAALRALRAQRVELFLELGPGASLARLAGQALPGADCRTVAAGEADPAQHTLELGARLWEAGVPVNWAQLWGDVQRS